ncbi:hypothetical protein ACSSZE_03410 [Acidithiobacillus caldus]
MYDFRSFSPLPGERFPACRPNLSMACPVPERMQDRFGRVYRYVGPLMGEPLAAGQVRVFPGHVYELEDSHAH